MKRPPYGSRPRLSREMAQLSWLASGLAQAGSRMERTYWHGRLQTLVEQLLTAKDDESLNVVLNRLSDSEPVGHDALMDTIESAVESTTTIIDGKPHDVLLIACPLLTWSRYAIPTPTLSAKDQRVLAELLLNTVLTRHARVVVLGMLVGPDQIPREFTQLAALTQNLTQALVNGKAAPLHTQAQEETNRFLSDTRYLIAATAVPKGDALFRWQEPRATGGNSQLNDRADITQLWASTCMPILEPMLAGCRVSAVLPDAFHAACAAADRASRPYSVQACINFLSESIDLPPEKQRAVIGPFHAQRLEEYRIALGPRNEDALYHGVVWPLLGIEDEQTDMVAEIEQVLRAAGVTDIVTHEHRFPMEFCEDCGGPMYANADGELAHLEMPESAAAQPSTLH
ncbi:MAG: DUF2863 family protein [Rhodocyclaceae bacterium]|nr:DUF2863 family protein [Rhodocyclaceae bacterium]